MTVKYKTVITKAGAIKLAAATVPNGKKVNFTAMAIGDGGGTLPVPDASQTKLVNEVWRHTLNKISQDNKNQNYVIAELLIPPETGGFWMREMGLYDDTGTLIAVGNMAESYKPELAEGSGRAQTVRMVIMVSDIESVELTIDTSTVMATQDYVDDKLAEHEQSRRHPDATLTEKGFTQLSSATDSASETLAATPKAVKTAYDLAKGKYTAQDATTAQKGIVQLSSATDSTSETLAATPKAVKEVKGIAEGKYTAQDATTAQKGIVQLSSATDSASETLAATPKAVKAANDNANGRVPSGRRVNGRALAEDINITSLDIFNGQAVLIGNAADLNSFTTPGLYYQSSNAQAQAGTNYPEAVAGSLEVYKHAGVTQVYRIYADSRSYIRAFYNGAWTSWAKQYDAANKPTPGDIGAVPASGGRVAYLENATYYKTNPAGWYGGGAFADQYRNNAAPFLVPYGFVSTKDVSVYLPIVKGISHTAVHGYAASVSFGILRSGKADFGSAVINIVGDNGNAAVYSYDVNGTFNAPGQVYSGGTIVAAGQISSGTHIIATQGVFESGGAVRVYSSNNPPTQYAVRDWITSVGLEGNNPSAPYMRQESSGNLVPLATQDWVSSYFGMVNGFRRGGQQLQNPTDAFFGNWESPAGCVVTGITMEGRSDGRKLGVYYRQMQYFNKQTNSWINVGD
ncbi:phage tail-collar fiber domain-containing protein [Enterobacter asburiae]|uniref:phage tail-collar fiber domain-containing protein n=1 Tax=Enterobacter asburiae TaxID=61645 RepID=UPI001F2921B6|nr:phage tail protein [Enterobacter asburiae]